jgi:hypothetical protein
VAIIGEIVGFMLKKLNDEDPYPGVPEPPLFTSELESEELAE